MLTRSQLWPGRDDASTTGRPKRFNPKQQLRSRYGHRPGHLADSQATRPARTRISSTISNPGAAVHAHLL